MLTQKSFSFIVHIQRIRWVQRSFHLTFSVQRIYCCHHPIVQLFLDIHAQTVDLDSLWRNTHHGLCKNHVTHYFQINHPISTNGGQNFLEHLKLTLAYNVHPLKRILRLSDDTIQECRLIDFDMDRPKILVDCLSIRWSMAWLLCDRTQVS